MLFHHYIRLLYLLRNPEQQLQAYKQIKLNLVTFIFEHLITKNNIKYIFILLKLLIP